MTWDPQEYVLGNYFQNEINELFRKQFPVEPFGNILDIGCGDGHYSRILADHFKHSHILGIDNSVDMIRHARQHWASRNLIFEVHNIEDFQSTIAFDFALSFWCLHWTNIHLSIPVIFQALKSEGRFYAVFSSFLDNSILQICYELVKQNRSRGLANMCLDLNKSRKNHFYSVINVLNGLTFKHVKLELKTTYTYFPTIDYLKNLLLTLPFIKRLYPEIIDNFINDLASRYLIFKDMLPIVCHYGNGRAFSSYEIMQINQVTHSHSCVLNWQKGDFLMVDNFTFMHGKQAHQGERLLYSCMTAY